MLIYTLVYILAIVMGSIEQISQSQSIEQNNQIIYIESTIRYFIEQEYYEESLLNLFKNSKDGPQQNYLFVNESKGFIIQKGELDSYLIYQAQNETKELDSVYISDGFKILKLSYRILLQGDNNLYQIDTLPTLYYNEKFDNRNERVYKIPIIVSGVNHELRIQSPGLLNLEVDQRFALETKVANQDKKIFSQIHRDYLMTQYYNYTFCIFQNCPECQIFIIIEFQSEVKLYLQEYPTQPYLFYYLLVDDELRSYKDDQVITVIKITQKIINIFVTKYLYVVYEHRIDVYILEQNKLVNTFNETQMGTNFNPLYIWNNPIQNQEQFILNSDGTLYIGTLDNIEKQQIELKQILQLDSIDVDLQIFSQNQFVQLKKLLNNQVVGSVYRRFNNLYQLSYTVNFYDYKVLDYKILKDYTNNMSLLNGYNMKGRTILLTYDFNKLRRDQLRFVVNLEYGMRIDQIFSSISQIRLLSTTNNENILLYKLNVENQCSIYISGKYFPQKSTPFQSFVNLTYFYTNSYNQISINNVLIYEYDFYYLSNKNVGIPKFQNQSQLFTYFQSDMFFGEVKYLTFNNSIIQARMKNKNRVLQAKTNDLKFDYCLYLAKYNSTFCSLKNDSNTFQLYLIDQNLFVLYSIVDKNIKYNTSLIIKSDRDNQFLIITQKFYYTPFQLIQIYEYLDIQLFKSYSSIEMAQSLYGDFIIYKRWLVREEVNKLIFYTMLIDEENREWSLQIQNTLSIDNLYSFIYHEDQQQIYYITNLDSNLYYFSCNLDDAILNFSNQGSIDIKLQLINNNLTVIDLSLKYIQISDHQQSISIKSNLGHIYNFSINTFKLNNVYVETQKQNLNQVIKIEQFTLLQQEILDTQNHLYKNTDAWIGQLPSLSREDYIGQYISHYQMDNTIIVTMYESYDIYQYNLEDYFSINLKSENDFKDQIIKASNLLYYQKSTIYFKEVTAQLQQVRYLQENEAFEEILDNLFGIEGYFPQYQFSNKSKGFVIKVRQYDQELVLAYHAQNLSIQYSQNEIYEDSIQIQETLGKLLTFTYRIFPRNNQNLYQIGTLQDLQFNPKYNSLYQIPLIVSGFNPSINIETDNQLQFKKLSRENLEFELIQSEKSLFSQMYTKRGTLLILTQYSNFTYHVYNCVDQICSVMFEQQFNNQIQIYLEEYYTYNEQFCQYKYLCYYIKVNNSMQYYFNDQLAFEFELNQTIKNIYFSNYLYLIYEQSIGVYDFSSQINYFDSKQMGENFYPIKVWNHPQIDEQIYILNINGNLLVGKIQINNLVIQQIIQFDTTNVDLYVFAYDQLAILSESNNFQTQFQVYKQESNQLVFSYNVDLYGYTVYNYTLLKNRRQNLVGVQARLSDQRYLLIYDFLKLRRDQLKIIQNIDDNIQDLQISSILQSQTYSIFLIFKTFTNQSNIYIYSLYIEPQERFEVKYSSKLNEFQKIFNINYEFYNRFSSFTIQQKLLCEYDFYDLEVRNKTIVFKNNQFSMNLKSDIFQGEVQSILQDYGYFQTRMKNKQLLYFIQDHITDCQFTNIHKTTLCFVVSDGLYYFDKNFKLLHQIHLILLAPQNIILNQNQKYAILTQINQYQSLHYLIQITNDKIYLFNSYVIGTKSPKPLFFKDWLVRVENNNYLCFYQIFVKDADNYWYLRKDKEIKVANINNFAYSVSKQQIYYSNFDNNLYYFECSLENQILSFGELEKIDIQQQLQNNNFQNFELKIQYLQIFENNTTDFIIIKSDLGHVYNYTMNNYTSNNVFIQTDNQTIESIIVVGQFILMEQESRNQLYHNQEGWNHQIPQISLEDYSGAYIYHEIQNGLLTILMWQSDGIYQYHLDDDFQIIIPEKKIPEKLQLYGYNKMQGNFAEIKLLREAVEDDSKTSIWIWVLVSVIGVGVIIITAFSLKRRFRQTKQQQLL